MFERVAIAGVGLMGASLGLALRQRGLCQHVLGIGRDRARLEEAHQLGAIDEFAVGVGPELANVDLLVVCVAVDAIAPLILKALPLLPRHAIVTDAGSTKAEIVAAIERDAPGARFVGGHPLAGSEKRGAAAAIAGLYEGKRCVVTATDRTDPEALARVTAFWQSLGMTVLRLSPVEHDRVLARTSHLPHLAAAALAATLGAADRPFAATGFRDTTRVAGGDPGLWTAIFAQNRAALLDALAGLESQLAAYRQALTHSDLSALEQLLTDGKRNRDALGN